MPKKLLALSCLILSLAANAANAATLLWTIDNPLVLNTGATITGSFQYNVDTGSYSNIQLLAANTANSADGLYSAFAVGDSNYINATIDEVIGSLTGVTALQLTSADGLFSNPGTVSLFDAGIITCDNADCSSSSFTTDQASIFNGDIGTMTSSVVPIPAAAWLFGSALLGLGAVKRKRAS